MTTQTAPAAPITPTAARRASLVWFAIVGAALVAMVYAPTTSLPVVAVIAVAVIGSYAVRTGAKLWDYADRAERAER